MTITKEANSLGKYFSEAPNSGATNNAQETNTNVIDGESETNTNVTPSELNHIENPLDQDESQ